MNENTSGTLLKLLSIYSVEIPIIQRDYAQGRQDSHTVMVRTNLLSDMKEAIQYKAKPLDLNFVYGKVEGDKFIPIDGQQRLTTLFLLHVYAFFDDDSITGLLHRFSYETRTSSRHFLENLIDNRNAVFVSTLLPSMEIEDSEWFVAGWKFDPTIQSVLTMLDDIKANFCQVQNLAQILSNQDFEPIIFKFLEMKDLGMEDSLYIKLNARGKPLTPFENFKARFIGRLQKMKHPFTTEFEQSFDKEWTDLFWVKVKESFDEIYLTFFGVLLMNKEICQNDNNWSDTLNYEQIGEDVYETVFYTLKFLCDNPDRQLVHRFVFNALSDRRSYSDRLLFHAVATYLYLSRGRDTGSFEQWTRIIQNLVLNSQIDSMALYRRAIDGINKVAANWKDLLQYFSDKGSITGFAQLQIEEERTKAQIILKDTEFAEIIYEAELHPYFSGQIRSALYYSIIGNGEYGKDMFVLYWDKISLLFDDTRPRHRHLLRQALLTIGDYTLKVGTYQTLCVDDPNEAASTPSMKQLFSNHGHIVKKLLDMLNLEEDIEAQLKGIIKNSVVPQSDWRYCFIEFPNLFNRMSVSHLRLRHINGESLIVPNKSSNGYNYNVFLASLSEALELHGINSSFMGDLGSSADRYMFVRGYSMRFSEGHFILADEDGTVVFKTKEKDLITEATNYFL